MVFEFPLQFAKRQVSHLHMLTVSVRMQQKQTLPAFQERNYNDCINYNLVIVTTQGAPSGLLTAGGVLTMSEQDQI